MSRLESLVSIHDSGQCGELSQNCGDSLLIADIRRIDLLVVDHPLKVRHHLCQSRGIGTANIERGKFRQKQSDLIREVSISSRQNRQERIDRGHIQVWLFVGAEVCDQQLIARGLRDVDTDGGECLDQGTRYPLRTWRRLSRERPSTTSMAWVASPFGVGLPSVALTKLDTLHVLALTSCMIQGFNEKR
jgi:hypothetical protein